MPEPTKECLKDDKILFKHYMNTNLLPEPLPERSYYLNKNGLELIIRPECNLHCEYCYIAQHGKELYPTRIDKEKTLKNLDLFLDYIYNIRKNYFYVIELFAGDLFYDEIFFDIMDLFKKYLTPIKERFPEIFNQLTVICIPSNLTFVIEKPHLKEKIYQLLNEFRENFNIKISFSWSTDGMYATDIRERKKLDERYFDTIFEFCIKTNSGYHPMLSAQSMNTAIQNYDWWMEKMRTIDPTQDFQPMLLEVRNDDWTDESIEQYMKLLDHMMETRFKMCDSDYDKLAYHFWIGDGQNGTLKTLGNYDPLMLTFNSQIPQEEKISCTVQSDIMLNCTNLSLVLCHRTTYPHLTPAYFITDENNEHIIDYKVNNVATYLSCRTVKNSMLPICIDCEWNDICLHGCFGAQYEAHGEILAPIPSVCKMFKQKFSHLLKLYYKYNIIQLGLDKKYIDENLQDKIIDFCRKAGLEI